MRTIVAVVRGGPAHLAEESLASGGALLRALDPERYQSRDVFISHDGYWHLGGVPMAPVRAIAGADAVFNCLHGYWGHDGWLQHLLHTLGHTVAGSRPSGATLAFSRERSKDLAGRLGLRVPKHQVIVRGEDAQMRVFDLYRTFPLPAVIKSPGATGHPSVIAADLDAYGRAVQDALHRSPRVLIEEHVRGTPVTVAMLEGWHGEDLHALVEGALSESEKEALCGAARRMHEELGLRHFSASQFVVTPRDIWYLKTEAFPSFRDGSLFGMALGAAGIGMPQFVDHVISLVR